MNPAASAPVPLHNLHEILYDSAFSYSEYRAHEPLVEKVCVSFMVSLDDRVELQKLCVRHGTTQSSFLRAVVRTLIAEMQGA